MPDVCRAEKRRDSGGTAQLVHRRIFEIRRIAGRIREVAFVHPERTVGRIRRIRQPVRLAGDPGLRAGREIVREQDAPGYRRVRRVSGEPAIRGFDRYRYGDRTRLSSAGLVICMKGALA